MRLIVGLGNPEDKYANTRHNLGFEIVDALRKKLKGGEWSLEGKFKAEICKVSPDLMLVRPETYMNNSGMAVSKIANYFKVLPEDVLIIHDELDLPLSHLKIRLGGAAAGHHGVESVITSLGTDKFIRLRCGIGNLRSQSSEHGGQHFQAEHYVLESFMPTEKHEVKKMVKQAVKAIEVYLEKGLEKAQNQYN
jgi:peptidyl-tRNA hydrolase, PTH1 family